jgi:hypothetical protein
MTQTHAIDAEAQRIESDALWTAQTNFIQATFYRRLHYWIGGSAVVLAGVASASVITDWSDAAAGICALIATVLTALLTFVNPERQWIEHNWQGAAYRDLQHDARRLRTVYGGTMSEGDRATRLQDLARRHGELNRTNKPSERAFKKAQRKVRSGDMLQAGDEALV